MNNEKGITLASLVIYVIMFTLILGALASFSSYIYPNINTVNSSSYSSEEFNKFNINFIRDVKTSTDARVETSTTSNGDNVKIILSNGANYNYIASEQAIYRNEIKIAQKIYTFTAEKLVINKNIDKNVIKVRIGTGKNENDFGKTINYVLKYW